MKTELKIEIVPEVSGIGPALAVELRRLADQLDPVVAEEKPAENPRRCSCTGPTAKHVTPGMLWGACGACHRLWVADYLNRWYEVKQ